MNQYEYVSLEKKNHVIIVTIKRQQYMNALHPPACRELDSIFDQFAEDPDSWVAIITGEGEKAFCAGNDLKWMTVNGRDAYHREVNALKGGWGGITKRFNCYKPIIAAVNGLALGGGFELALACDIIIASENAKFGLPEPKVGMMASAGGINRLTRQIPYHIAMGYILTGSMMTASQAYQYGIVNEVVAKDTVMKQAERWAGQILECAPLSVRAAKESVLKSYELPYSESIGKLYSEFEKMINSDDYVEGPRAFSEKRKPDWKGM
jgi:enoyl-CoA hydratase/carnithine racemase